MKILFLHGWHSTPGGVKPTYLKDHGHEVLNPALPDDDFDAAVRIAQAEFDTMIRLDRPADGFRAGLPRVAIPDRDCDCGTGIESVKKPSKPEIEPERPPSIS